MIPAVIERCAGIDVGKTFFDSMPADRAGGWGTES